MAHVLLIYPRPNRITFDTAHTINLGLAYLAAVLEQRGHTVVVHDFFLDADHLFPERARRADLVGIYTITAAHKAALAIAERIKTQLNAGCRVVMGGPHPTSRPGDPLESPWVDYVAIGEGEKLICALVDHLGDAEACRQLPGVAYRNEQGQVVSNGPAEFPTNLDDLPFPAYHLFPTQRFTPTRPTWVNAKKLRCGSMMTSRGCPFRCTFCTSAAGRPFGKKFRAMSPERTVEEMAWLVRDWGINFIELQDDVFNLVTSRAEEICRLLIRRKLPVRWSIPNGISRVENVTEDFMRLCKQAGCVDAWFAAESGSARVRDEIIVKQNSIDQVRQAIEASKRAGLQTGAFFVFGSPDETPEEMEQTIDFACSLPLDRAQFTIATPFPGTAMWDRITKEGRWLITDYDQFGPYENVVHFELGRMKRDDVLRAYKRAFRRFFLRPSYLLRKVMLRKETYTNLPLLARQAVRFMT